MGDRAATFVLLSAEGEPIALGKGRHGRPPDFGYVAPGERVVRVLPPRQPFHRLFDALLRGSR